MNPAFCVTDGQIVGRNGPILAGIDLAVPRGATTVVLGPAAVGKSVLLRALAGTGHDLRRLGTWLSSESPARRTASQPAYFPQPARERPHASAGWDGTFAPGVDVYLLDEPCRRCAGDGELAALTEALKRRPEHVTVLLITHNVALARAVADYVCFVCDGEVALAPAEQFFASPPGELAARFVATGNCWPRPRELALPSHFRWLVPESVAGMGRPGLLRSTEEDLAAIATAGIDLLVSLTEEAFPPSQLRSFGIDSRHFPIRDMGVPGLSATARLCAYVQRQCDGGRRVAFHCHAGLGRTGLLLAAMLVWSRSTAEQAIERVRQLRPGYIQSPAQERFVAQFAQHCP